MKVLKFEIEFTEEEAERFERFIEEGHYDTGNLLHKWIIGTLNRIEFNKLSSSGRNPKRLAELFRIIYPNAKEVDVSEF